MTVGESQAARVALRRIGESDQDVPRRGDGEEDGHARKGAQLADARDRCAWAASQHQVDQNDRDGEDDADQALGQYVEGAAAGEGPAESAAWRCS